MLCKCSGKYIDIDFILKITCYLITLGTDTFIFYKLFFIRIVSNRYFQSFFICKI